MFRIAIQVKELISSNVTSALEGVSDPAKMLGRLRLEIEEALIALTGELTKAKRQKDQLEAELTQAELRAADWSDKAGIAMDNGREDLARQALIAREDCNAGIERLREELERLGSDIAGMESAMRELETKREDVRQQHADQLAADGAGSSVTAGSFAKRTDKRMDDIADLEQRTAFATEDATAGRGNSTVDREIEEMRRERKIADELDAMRGKDGAAKAPAKKRASRSKSA